MNLKFRKIQYFVYKYIVPAFFCVVLTYISVLGLLGISNRFVSIYSPAGLFLGIITFYIIKESRSLSKEEFVKN